MTSQMSSRRYIAGMTFPDMLAAVIIGNGLTISFLYMCWRLNRDDRFGNILVACIVLFCIGVIGWTLRPELPRDTYKSVVDRSSD